MLLEDIIPTKNIRLGHEAKTCDRVGKRRERYCRLMKDDLPPIRKMLAELRRTLEKLRSA